MILTAGVGERMAPLSAACAKPALPVLDRPIVAHLVARLAEQGVERIVLNTHAHPDTVRDAVRDSPVPIDLSHEPSLLGSAGGIRAARRHLEGPEPFVVLNGDMLLDLDLPSLLARHRESGGIATLGVREDRRKEAFGTIGYDDARTVCRITEIARRPADKGDVQEVDIETGCGLFIGVQVLDAEIFERMPDRTPLGSVSDVYAPMVSRGERIAVWQQPQDADWWPIGSPRELLEANLLALERTTPPEGARSGPAQSGSAQSGERARLEPPIWLGAGAQVPADARLAHTVVGAGAVVPAGSSWRSSLLLPGARPPVAGEFHRAIAFGTEIWRDG